MKNFVTGSLFSLIALLALLSLCHVSGACTLSLPIIKKFDASEYVFTGHVLGVVGPFKSSKLEGETWSVRIKVDEAINLPKTPVSYFEVMPYGLRSDCATVGASAERLTKEFPVGSKVRVIAEKAKLLPSKLDGGNIRLEITPESLGDISRNYHEDASQMTSASSVFDYKAYREVTPKDYTEAFMPFLDAQVTLPRFELRKDLLRLRNATSEEQKLSILNRLLYYPERYDFDFEKIAAAYVRDRAKLGTLIKRRRAWDNRDADAEG